MVATSAGLGLPAVLASLGLGEIVAGDAALHLLEGFGAGHTGVPMSSQG